MRQDSIAGLDAHRCFDFSQEIRFGSDKTEELSESADIQDFASLEQELQVFCEGKEAYASGDYEKAAWLWDLIAGMNPTAAVNAELARQKLAVP